MRFAHPLILWLMIATLPALVAFLAWARRRRATLISLFVQSRLQNILVSRTSPGQDILRLSLLTLAVATLFLTLAHDDKTDIMEDTLRVYAAWRKARIPAELHIFWKGGHGFGIRKRGNPTDAYHRLLREIGKIGKELSTARKAAAEKLSAGIETELNDLRMAGGGFAGVAGRFDRHHQADIRDGASGNCLGGGNFRVEQDSRRPVRDRLGYIQFEAREFNILHKGGICLAEVLAMIEREGRNRAAPG